MTKRLDMLGREVTVGVKIIVGLRQGNVGALGIARVTGFQKRATGEAYLVEWLQESRATGRSVTFTPPRAGWLAVDRMGGGILLAEEGVA